jgi:hypothetical protein
LQGMRQLEDLSIESKKLEKKVLVIFPWFFVFYLWFVRLFCTNFPR